MVLRVSDCNSLNVIRWKGTDYTNTTEFNQALKDAGILDEGAESAWTRV